MPTGFSTDEKKALRRKIVGGNMYGVLHNQYWADGMIEAAQRETQFHFKKNCEKLDYAKFFNTRTTQVRKEFNLQKIKKQNENDPHKSKLQHKLGQIPAFYPQNKLNEL